VDSCIAQGITDGDGGSSEVTDVTVNATTSLEVGLLGQTSGALVSRGPAKQGS
jgi:hypothetical protein